MAFCWVGRTLWRRSVRPINRDPSTYISSGGYRMPWPWDMVMARSQSKVEPRIWPCRDFRVWCVVSSLSLFCASLQWSVSRITITWNEAALFKCAWHLSSGSVVPKVTSRKQDVTSWRVFCSNLHLVFWRSPMLSWLIWGLCCALRVSLSRAWRNASDCRTWLCMRCSICMLRDRIWPRCLRQSRRWFKRSLESLPRKRYLLTRSLDKLYLGRWKPIERHWATTCVGVLPQTVWGSRGCLRLRLPWSWPSDFGALATWRDVAKSLR